MCGIRYDICTLRSVLETIKPTSVCDPTSFLLANCLVIITASHVRELSVVLYHVLHHFTTIVTSKLLLKYQDAARKFENLVSDFQEYSKKNQLHHFEANPTKFLWSLFCTTTKLSICQLSHKSHVMQADMNFNYANLPLYRKQPCRAHTSNVLRKYSINILFL